MLSNLESRVVHLEESMGEVNETFEVVKTRSKELNPIKEQFKEYVMKALSSNVDTLQALLNTIVDKLTERNDALEATMMTLNTKIEELEGELAMYRVVMEKRVLNVTLRHKIDVPKSEKFNEARSARELGNLL